MGILADGFNTTISFPGAGVTFIEKEVTPPAIDGGGEINITAMRNLFWRTKAPKYLVTMDKLAIKARYDPVVYGAGGIRAVVNSNRQITLAFPTLFLGGANSAPAVTVAFYGWLNKFAPEAMKEGDEPLADIEIIPSMQNNGIETGPTTVPA